MSDIMISPSTIEQLARIITGDGEAYPKYRTGRDLERFFEEPNVDCSMLPGESRFNYTCRMLGFCFGVSFHNQRTIISEALFLGHWLEEKGKNADTAKKKHKEVLDKLHNFFKKDGYLLVHNEDTSKVELHLIETSSVAVESVPMASSSQASPQIETSSVVVESVPKLKQSFVQEQLSKANKRMSEGDYDGAISTARSLVEAVQVELIKAEGHTVNDYAGDLNKLFKQTKTTFNLNPSQKDISDTLKQILTGLNSVVIGVAGLSNIIGDRHARKYTPSKHHAKLAVNSALTFCEFLIDSFEYQKKGSSR